MSKPDALELTHKDRSRSLLLAGGFAAFACLALLVTGAWHEWSARSADLRNAEIEMANLAKSLIQHADDTFEITDIVLTGVVAALERNGTSPDALARLQTFLELRKSVSRVRGLFVYDRDGSWLATTENVDRSKFNNSDRDYFQSHARSTSREILIGKPVKSKAGGEWIVTISRRFDRPDGSFGGVALATVETNYFSQFYAQFDTGPHGAISLLNEDGILLARSKNPEVYVARDLSDSPWFTRERRDSEVYHFTSPLDGRERLSVYQRSKRYPLLVFATKAKEDVLAAWRRDATVRLAVLLLFVLLIGFAGKKLVQYLSERVRMVQALKGKEADFRLLAEESSDMVMRIDVKGVVQYVSPSCTRLIGWTVSQIEGTSALANINPSDLSRVERAIASIRLGEVEETKVIYRSRHRDRGEIWIETSLRVTHAPATGEVDGVVAISRDMTVHKDFEEKLAVLATSDGLTGLANRRHFDERLEKEWETARRSGSPISLVLIDVDHFKKFNDLYGHPGGDVCLRSVARVISGFAFGPEGLAARYGGEEFVLLLPGVAEQEAQSVAALLLEAVRAIDIQHARNFPSKRVTVSAGLSTAYPTAEAGRQSALVADADHALYEAKAEGRDRFAVSRRDERKIRRLVAP